LNNIRLNKRPFLGPANLTSTFHIASQLFCTSENNVTDSLYAGHPLPHQQ
jgi:hypothetical protein